MFEVMRRGKSGIGVLSNVEVTKYEVHESRGGGMGDSDRNAFAHKKRNGNYYHRLRRANLIK